jgi:uncharacterized protein YrrD
MEFQNDAPIYTNDGIKIGRIGWVVLEPRSNAITHIIVKEGFMFEDDKVVPIDAVESAKAERVTLRAGLDPKAFPDYEDVDYVPTEIEGSNYPSDGGNRPRAIVHRPPLAGLPAAALLVPIFLGTGDIPEHHPETEADGALPEGAVSLKVGAKVTSIDGMHMGDLERIYTESGRATHILISRGAAFTTEKVVPVAWISKVDDAGVHLSMRSTSLQNLPDPRT